MAIYLYKDGSIRDTAAGPVPREGVAWIFASGQDLLHALKERDLLRNLQDAVEDCGRYQSFGGNEAVQAALDALAKFAEE